ncbi:MAG: hypothetical protein ACRD6X_15845 [Pyrinomonadaceae bacterium]
MKRFQENVWLVFPMRFYHGLIITLPKEFREKYEREMVQVFRECCRDAYGYRGGFGVMSELARSTFDLLVNAVKERFASLVSDDRRMLALLTISVVAVVGGLYAAFAELRSDEVPGSVFMVFLFSFVLGFLRPSSFLLTGFLVGFMLPVMHFVVRMEGRVLPDQTDAFTPIWGFLMLIPALVGSISGGVFRSLSNYVSNRFE